MGSHSSNSQNKNMDACKIIITILCVLCAGCEPTTSATAIVSFTITNGDSVGVSVIKWSTTINNPDRIATNVTVEIVAVNAYNTIAADDVTVKIGPLETIKVQHEFDVPTYVASDVIKLTRNLVWERED